MRKQQGLLSMVVAIVATIIIGLVVSTSVFAADANKYDEAWLMKKILINGIYTCYNGGHIRAKMTIGGNGNFSNSGSIALDNTDGVVKLPNGYTGIADNDLSCQELLHGYNGVGGNFGGIFSYSSMSEATSSSSVAEQGVFLEKMGYEKNASSGAAGGRKCARFKYIMTNVENGSETAFANEVFTQQICAQVDSNGNITSEIEKGVGATGVDPLGLTVIPGSGIMVDGFSSSPTDCMIDGNFDACVSALHNFWQSQKSSIAGGTIDSGNYSNYVASDEIDWETNSTFIPDYAMPTAKPDVATQSLFGDSNKNFTSDEVISMYQSYLNKYMEDMFCIIDDSVKDTPVNASYTPVHLVVGGEYYEDCYVKKGSSAPSTLNGFDGTNWSKEVTFDNDILPYLKANSASNPQQIISANARLLDKDGVEQELPDPNNPYSGQTTEGDPSKRCYDSAGVMGHILCPILSAVSQFTDAIYNYVENNFLMINASEMTGDEVRSAWGVVRDIANVAFVIVLLVVIFSQVTGIGIDNYGIKRILPRLIVTAVLVNISFLICQIFVDISNILGVNIKEFLSTAIPLKAGVIGNSGGAAGILGTIAAGGILTAVVILNPGVILSLVTGIIGVVIALLFMFVILIARQIGVVLLIVLSPVAFICYMLPNTEKIFTNWRKIFIALLLAYPICSLAMGGGTMVANILANTGDVSGNAVLLIGAMIVNVLPFFFIPTILKKSMAGLGNLGATLSGLGKSLGRGATGAMRGSAGYKALQGAGAERKNRIKAGLDKEGNLTKIGKIKAGIADSKFGKSMGYGKLQKARIASAEKTITDQALGTGQLVDNAVAERFQNSVNAIKTQATNDGTINNLAGNKNFAGMGDDFDFADDTLEGRAYQAAMSGNKEEMYAYMELLSGKGHAGQEGATQVISKLQANGQHAAAQTMAQAIMNNPSLSGQYKSGARSQYNGLKDLAAAKDASTVANIRSASNIKAGDYSKQSLASADREELERIAAAINDPNFKDADKLRTMAAGALNDSMIEGGTKLKNEEIMKQIAGVPANEGAIQVRDSSSSNSRFEKLSNDQLLDAATRPGVDSGTADRAMREIERRQKDGTMKV